MKVLATVQPGESVFAQLAPLLVALQADGHEVAVATSPSFGAVVARRGLTPVAAGLDWVESDVAAAFPDVMDHVHDPHGALVDFMLGLFVDRTRARFGEDCARLIAERQPDLVVHSFSELGGFDAAEAAGVPHVLFVAGLDSWSARFRPALPGGGRDLSRSLRHGVVVAEVPSWSSTPLEEVDVAWMRPATATPASRPSPDATGRPMVHVTLGTVFNSLARPLFRVLAEGSSTVAARVVVTVGPGLDPARFTGLPPNVEVHQYVPLGELLTGCDGVLAHAGWGTVTACAAAGVPVGAIVLGADHGENAAIVERAGFGFRVDPAECTPDSAAAWTARLLEDEQLRAGAREQRARIDAMPAAEDVARSLADRFAPT